jgi:Prenyltransferase and squalene oxidase repeat
MMTSNRIVQSFLATALVTGLRVEASRAVAREQVNPPDLRAVESRAVAYLKTEVPRWRRMHPCYSCHNSGDATRALLAAAGRGHDIGDAIDDTVAWLGAPERWAANAMRGGSEDLPPARVQFASALAAAVVARRAKPAALDRAAQLLISHQHADGSWRLSESQLLGGATFYGTSLATAMARRSLSRATLGAAPSSRARAARWLRALEPMTVLDASSLLLGLDGDSDAAAEAPRRNAIDVLRRGQGPDGGWGPYINSPSEPFDTALAVLALRSMPAAGSISRPPASDGERIEAIRRASAYLASTQNSDGSWPETTRPPNGESYAQRISTTAWALLALFEAN